MIHSFFISDRIKNTDIAMATRTHQSQNETYEDRSNDVTAANQSGKSLCSFLYVHFRRKAVNTPELLSKANMMYGTCD